MANYYRWNIQALVDWTRNEVSRTGNFQVLSERLRIPQRDLREWLLIPFPSITLEHLQLIARYRSCDVDEVVHWLDIQPAHLSELREHSLAPSRDKGSSQLLSLL